MCWGCPWVRWMPGGSPSHDAKTGSAQPAWANDILCPFQMFSNSDEAVINKKLPKELLLRWVTFPGTSARNLCTFWCELKWLVAYSTITILPVLLLSTSTHAYTHRHKWPCSPLTQPTHPVNTNILTVHLLIIYTHLMLLTFWGKQTLRNGYRQNHSLLFSKFINKSNQATEHHAANSHAPYPTLPSPMPKL